MNWILKYLNLKSNLGSATAKYLLKVMHFFCRNNCHNNHPINSKSEIRIHREISSNEMGKASLKMRSTLLIITLKKAIGCDPSK